MKVALVDDVARRDPGVPGEGLEPSPIRLVTRRQVVRQRHARTTRRAHRLHAAVVREVDRLVDADHEAVGRRLREREVEHAGLGGDTGPVGVPGHRGGLSRAAHGDDHRGSIGNVVHAVVPSDLTAVADHDSGESVDETFPSAVEVPHPASERRAGPAGSPPRR